MAGAGLAIFPGLWLYGAYAYNYNNPYRFRNRSNTTNTNDNNNDRKRSIKLFTIEKRQTDSSGNETLPVTCLCDKYSACGCDDNGGNYTYIDELLGNGSYDSIDHTLINVTPVNGTRTVVLNGTLPNGTDDSTAGNGAGSLRQNSALSSGVWMVSGIVVAGLYLI